MLIEIDDMYVKQVRILSRILSIECLLVTLIECALCDAQASFNWSSTKNTSNLFEMQHNALVE